MIQNDRELPPVEDRRTTDTDGHDCIDPLGVAIVTVSSSRGDGVEKTPPDPSGDAIAGILIEAGHVVTSRRMVPDDYVRIKTTVSECLDRPDVDLVVTTGGTGVTVDDVTPDAVSELFDRELPGFGEAFRWLSWEEVRTRIVSTRATAGIARDVPVFVLPGSENAVELATAEIIAEEGPHLAGLATRHANENVDSEQH
jgi:molybdenum cofactor biosynthesis protein B